MELAIITIYCISEDFLKAINYHDDRQSIMTTAEVMTTAFVAAVTIQGIMNTVVYFSKSMAIFLKCYQKVSSTAVFIVSRLMYGTLFWHCWPDSPFVQSFKNIFDRQFSCTCMPQYPH